MRYGSGGGRRTEQCDEETCAVPTSEEDEERIGGRSGKKGARSIGEKPRL
jgi:hypothetical protein